MMSPGEAPAGLPRRALADSSAYVALRKRHRPLQQSGPLSGEGLISTLIVRRSTTRHYASDSLL